MPTIGVAVAKRGRLMTQMSLRAAVRAVCALTILLMLVILLAAVAWLVWVSADRILGTSCAALIAPGLLAGAAAFSRCSGRPFAYSLIMVAFGSFALFAAALYGVAGYVLVFGG